MVRMVIPFFCGWAIGIANLIPGVSGGTFAFIFGIYDRLISAVNKLSTCMVADSARFLSNLREPKERQRFLDKVKASDLWFLIQIGAGALLAVGLAASLIEYLIEFHRAPIYAFFLGLVLTSVPLPYRFIHKKTGFLFILMFLAALVTGWLGGKVDPSEKVLQKSKVYQAQLERRSPMDDEVTFKKLAVLFAAGALAISTMALPGISGSLILLLMGQYLDIIKAVSSLKTHLIQGHFYEALAPASLLGSVALGCLIGLAVFCRLFEKIYKKIPDRVNAILLGFMIGSCYALWPFKEVITREVYMKKQGIIEFVQGVALYTNENVFFNVKRYYETQAIWLSGLCFLIGILLMQSILKFSKTNSI